MVILATILIIATPGTTHALTGSDWQAGNIIDDSLFYNGNAMSVTEIQNFLNSLVPECDTWGTKMYNGSQTRAQYGTSKGAPPPYICIKDYYENPTTHETNFNPSASIPAGALSAAQIIYNAAQTYNISPKVLLVTLKKEAVANLIADDWPWLSQYRTSMGYGCPDTAPCDSEYYGFYNQINKAAWQFRRYVDSPNSFRHRAGQIENVYYHPNLTGCSSSPVLIHNYATAGLYNYTPYQPNAAALANLYGTGDGCSSYGNRNFWVIWNGWFGSTQHESKLLSYKSHVKNIGWLGSVNSGVTGTTGQSRPLEAFFIKGEVEYTSYNINTGWQPTVSKGMISGTTGMSRPIQAIKINPIGSLAENFDVYYRVHVSNIGWMGWAKNGEPAGVTGQSNRNIEAFEIYLAPKNAGFSAPGSTDNKYINNGVVNPTPEIALKITSHVGYVGWQPTVYDTMASGTVEQNKRVEAVKIELVNNTGFDGSIVYSSHLANKGWQDVKSNGDISGTTGESRRMEAIRIALTGDLAKHYDVWYRGHVQSVGWLGWAKNGAAAGSVGISKQLEAIELRLAPKDTLHLTAGALLNPNNQQVPESYTIGYSAHVRNIGWLDSVTANEMAGTTGESRPLEAIRIDQLTSILGTLSINCSAYVKNSGWTSIVSSGTCGTTGQSKPAEAIKLTLSGTAADLYDIQYRVHLSQLGWQDWVADGATAGIPDSGKNIEAVIIRLVQK